MYTCACACACVCVCVCMCIHIYFVCLYVRREGARARAYPPSPTTYFPNPAQPPHAEARNFFSSLLHIYFIHFPLIVLYNLNLVPPLRSYTVLFANVAATLLFLRYFASHSGLSFFPSAPLQPSNA